MKNWTIFQKFSKSKLDAGYLVILAALTAALLFMNNGHNWGDDFSQYILHAQNIASGKAYVDPRYIYHADTALIGPSAYPPVFPLMLAPIVAVTGVHLAYLKIIGVACFSAFLFIFYRRISKREELSKGMQIVLIASLAFHPFFWNMVDNILSDLPFLFFTFLALELMERFVKTTGQKAGDIILASLLIYLAYGTRTIGILLLPVFVIYEFATWRKVRWVTTAVIVAALLLMVIQAGLIHGTKDYLDQIPRSISQLINVLRAARENMLYALYSLLFPVYRPVEFYLLFPILGLAGVGYGYQVIRRLSPFEIFAPIYVCSILIWPAFIGLRFLIPVIPLLLFYIFKGMEQMLRWFKASRKVYPILANVLLVVLTASYLVGYQDGPFLRNDEIHQASTTQLMKFVRTKTDPQATLIFFKPRAMVLLTGRKSTLALESPDLTADLANLKQLGADYLIVRENYADEFQVEWSQLAKSNPDHFALRYQNEMFTAYQIHY